jgi:hypothetical protein
MAALCQTCAGYTRNVLEVARKPGRNQAFLGYTIMHLPLSIVAFAFGFFGMVGARHFLGELLALVDRRPPALCIDPHDPATGRATARSFPDTTGAET